MESRGIEAERQVWRYHAHHGQTKGSSAALGRRGRVWKTEASFSIHSWVNNCMYVVNLLLLYRSWCARWYKIWEEPPPSSKCKQHHSNELKLKILYTREMLSYNVCGCDWDHSYWYKIPWRYDTVEVRHRGGTTPCCLTFDPVTAPHWSFSHLLLHVVIGHGLCWEQNCHRISFR